jgi:hypothetical protein
MTIDFRDYAVTFCSTLVLETAVAWALGLRKRWELAAVVLVNVFSHPLLIFSLWTLAIFREPVGPWEEPWFEAAVVVIEWSLLVFALPRRSKWHLLGVSAAMNGVSYLAGIVTFR